MSARRFAKGDVVVTKGSPSDSLLFLVMGRLQAVDYTEDGREIGLNLFISGSYFGELALIDGQPRSASIIALESSVVLSLPRDPATRLIYGNPRIAEELLKNFARGIRNLTVFRSLLAIPNTHQRLYALLSHLMQPTKGSDGIIENLPTQRQIAIMINTSRETVSRALAELSQRGILVKSGHTIIVSDRLKLAQLAATGTL